MKRINWNMVDGYYKDVGITFRWTGDWETRMYLEDDNDYRKPDIIDCGGIACYDAQLEFYS